VIFPVKFPVSREFGPETGSHMTAHTTKPCKHLAKAVTRTDRRGLHHGLQFCSRFELQHRSLCQLNIAAEIMAVENALDVSQAVAGEGRDLRHAAEAVDRGLSAQALRRGPHEQGSREKD
jgi:hypothetical protein